mmetsp:Transcript_35436/g.62919  ORF Transcript_35436/g.62919 Transcript_35436/m.62919 type:complete len:741 (-) Transcript_35436:37-2259(-)
MFGRLCFFVVGCVSGDFVSKWNGHTHDVDNVLNLLQTKALRSPSAHQLHASKHHSLVDSHVQEVVEGNNSVPIVVKPAKDMRGHNEGIGSMLQNYRKSLSYALGLELPWIGSLVNAHDQVDYTKYLGLCQPLCDADLSGFDKVFIDASSIDLDSGNFKLPQNLKRPTILMVSENGSLELDKGHTNRIAGIRSRFLAHSRRSLRCPLKPILTFHFRWGDTATPDNNYDQPDDRAINMSRAVDLINKTLQVCNFDVKVMSEGEDVGAGFAKRFPSEFEYIDGYQSSLASDLLFLSCSTVFIGGTSSFSVLGALLSDGVVIAPKRSVQYQDLEFVLDSANITSTDLHQALHKAAPGTCKAPVDLLTMEELPSAADKVSSSKKSVVAEDDLTHDGDLPREIPAAVGTFNFTGTSWLQQTASTFMMLETENNSMLHSWQTQEHWEQRWNTGIRASMDDPCGADVLVNGFNHPFGLGSRMGLVINEIAWAVYFNKSIAICNSDSFVETFWKRFYTSVPIGVCRKTDFCDPGFGQARLGNRLSHRLARLDKKRVWEFKHFIYRRMFSLKTESLNSIKRHWKLMGFNNTGEHIGVHVRHGDKEGEAALLPFDLYADATYKVQTSLDASPDHATVFIASDDRNAGDEMKKELRKKGSGYTVLFDFDEDSGNADELHQRSYKKKDHNVALLSDLHALITAKAFIGTQSSCLGRIVTYARGPDRPSESLDGDWEMYDPLFRWNDDDEDSKM